MLRPTSTGRLTAAPSQTRSSRWGGPRIRSSASRMTAAVALRTERQRLAWMRLPALRGPPPTRRPVDPHPPRGRSMSSTSFAGQLTSLLRYRSARRLPICSLARTGGRAVRTRQCRGVGGAHACDAPGGSALGGRHPAAGKPAALSCDGLTAHKRADLTASNGRRAQRSPAALTVGLGFDQSVLVGAETLREGVGTFREGWSDYHRVVWREVRFPGRAATCDWYPPEVPTRLVWSRTVRAEVEVGPVSAERVAPRRRWAGCLPVLVALLLALGSAAISGDTADAPRFGQVGTALAGVAASTHPAVASSRTETRLLAKRGESRAAGSPVAIGWAACRLAAPSGRWMTQGVAARSRIGERGDTYRGRGPPTGV